MGDDKKHPDPNGWEPIGPPSIFDEDYVFPGERQGAGPYQDDGSPEGNGPRKAPRQEKKRRKKEGKAVQKAARGARLAPQPEKAARAAKQKRPTAHKHSRAHFTVIFRFCSYSFHSTS